MSAAAAGPELPPAAQADLPGPPSTSTDVQAQALADQEPGGGDTGQDLAEQRLGRAIRELSSVRPGIRPAPYDAIRPGSGLSIARSLELFDAQLASRHLDLAARWLRARGAGFYTIGSSGHEGNAAVAAALRLTDPALLHYRSGAFYLVRAAQASPPRDGVPDVLLGLVAAAAEPIAGGRHKVFGHPELHVIPQTSTIASHLPRAVGLAFSLARAAKLGLDSPWPDDCLVVASFGDASANHSTAVGAMNTASWCAYQGLPLPLLLVCEDNGLGISVRTPAGWIESASSGRPRIKYFAADGADLAQTYDMAVAAADWVRRHRAPAFLHVHTVRLGGHAGTDVESGYRTPAEIAADTARDPLLGTARLLVSAGALSPAEVLDRYEASRGRVLAMAEAVAGAPRLATAAQVMAPLAPRRPAIIAANLAARSRQALPRQALPRQLQPRPTRSRQVQPAQPPQPAGAAPLTLAQAINRTLADEMADRPGMLVFGEDVARKGGVYGVTRGLQRTFGSGRVFDSPLDEQSILGMALGAGLAGLLPVPEIQYLAYLHNAADQIRGEAATLSFFSRAQYRNPLVVRVPGLAYQQGFGGHFHNDNGLAALRDIPGLVVACPARPDDAAAMLRTCLAAAELDGSVSVFVEPIALYHERDLFEAGDGGWLADYEPRSRWSLTHVPLGSGRLYGSGQDLTIISFGNGVRLSLRAARTLAANGIACRVLDLRWLAPLPYEDILRAAAATGRVLVADETRRTGGVSESVLTTLVDAGFTGRMARVASHDSFLPLGDATAAVLLSEAAIEDAAIDLLRG
jgi:2-oxoisovalerate dehydrogenase E1 component